MAIGDAHGLPLAIHTEAAAPRGSGGSDVAERLVEEKPLRERLLEEEILLLAPHRRWPHPSLPSMMVAACAAPPTPENRTSLRLVAQL